MLACAGLGACALVPGDKAYGLRDHQSAVKLPVRQEPAAEPVPDNVTINIGQPVTMKGAKIAVGESKSDANIPPKQLAAWTMVANELMNMDEVVNK